MVTIRYQSNLPIYPACNVAYWIAFLRYPVKTSCAKISNHGIKMNWKHTLCMWRMNSFFRRRVRNFRASACIGERSARPVLARAKKRQIHMVNSFGKSVWDIIASIKMELAFGTDWVIECVSVRLENTAHVNMAVNACELMIFMLPIANVQRYLTSNLLISDRTCAEGYRTCNPPHAPQTGGMPKLRLQFLASFVYESILRIFNYTT